MSRRRPTILEPLRRSRLAGWAAMLLLVFQVVLGADHLGAAAASAFGPSPQGEALGLLSLCHGDGSVELVAGDERDADRPGAAVPACMLCVVATLSANVLAVTPPLPVPPRPIVLGDLGVDLVDLAQVPPILRYGRNRGPPLPVLV